MVQKFTSLAIAELICAADGQALDSTTLNRVRYLAGRCDLLNDGEIIDGRGTQVFPALEVYRARVLVALQRFAIDARTLREVLEAAEARLPIHNGEWSPRMAAQRGSRGALRDAIAGVAAGERWQLVLATYPALDYEIPGFDCGPLLKVWFEWADAPNAGRVALTRFEKAPHGVLRIDLNELFNGLIASAGVPA